MMKTQIIKMVIVLSLRDYWPFSLLSLLPYFLLKRTNQQRRTGPTALLRAACEKWTHRRRRETKIIWSVFLLRGETWEREEEEIILKYSWWADGGGGWRSKGGWNWWRGDQRGMREGRKRRKRKNGPFQSKHRIIIVKGHSEFQQ